MVRVPTLVAAALLSLAQFANPATVDAQITLTTPLAISPASPVVGQAATATFTVRNSGSSTVTIPYFIAAGRSSSGANLDFPASQAVTLTAGQSYQYRATKTFSAVDTVSAWPSYFQGGSTWVNLAAPSKFTVTTAPAHLTVVTPLALSPSSPVAGQTVTATFAIKNDGGSPASIQYLLVGARNSSNANFDFPSAPAMSLQPGATYSYRQSRTLPQGTYSIWPSVSVAGTWTELAARTSITVGPAAAQYGYVPPAQTVSGGGSNFFTVPAGEVHQTAFMDGGTAQNIAGLYAYDFGGWKSMVWRWADTPHAWSLVRSTAPDGKPAYRMELTQNDLPSGGTSGPHPRAEFKSVDPAEDRRETGHNPPTQNIFRANDEYWATFAIYIPGDFPENHRWATLVQRKLDDSHALNTPVNWFTLNVHMDKIDVSMPGLPINDWHYAPFATLAEVKNRWIQVTVHEKLSTGSDGLFEIFLNGERKASRTGATIAPADTDANFNIHYGYYRANEPEQTQSIGPGVGVLYYSPLMLFKGANPTPTPVLP